MRRDQGKRPKRANMVVMVDEVPVDILIDILARLPLKSLVRFRCVSKPWCLLVTRPSFTRKRLLMNRAAADGAANQDHQQQKKHILVSKWPSSVCLYSFGQQRGTLIDFQFPFPKNKVLIGGYCDSMVCVKFKDQDIKHLALWNISTREYRTIPFMSSLDIPTNIFETLGLGYDFTADDLKIVRVLSGDSSMPSLVQVFSLKSNSWRASNQSSCYFRSANNLRPMVHLDGNLYGQGHYCFNGENSIEGIFRFDLATERFGDVVPSPPSGPGTKDVCLGVLGGCLVATVQCENHSTLWVLQKSAGGVGETWVKRFTNNSGSVMRPICFTDDGVGLVLADSDVGFVEREDNSSASFDLSRRLCFYYSSRSLGKNIDGAFELVESLVSPRNNF